MSLKQVLYYTNKFYLLVKYAQSTKLLDKLNSLNLQENIKNYVLSLDDKYKAHAINFLTNNIFSNLSDVIFFINELKEKEQKIQPLKEKSILKIKSILSNLDSDIPAKLESWLILQLKQYPNKLDIIKSNYNKIKNYVIEYDIDLPSYNIDSLLEYIEELSGNINIKSDSDDILKFLTKKHNELKEKINTLTNNDVKKWATKKSIDVIRGWLKQINAAIKEENKSFEKLSLESLKLIKDVNDGLYRDKELPKNPLIYNEYVKLIENLQNIDKWVNDKKIDILKYSILEAVDNANNYLKVGSSYDAINTSNIIKGPSGWDNEEYNGYFILELKSQNDLMVEGLLMDHCLSYTYKKIDIQQSGFFSIRNISNPHKPLVTIEGSKDRFKVYQYSETNSATLSNFYYGMILEAFQDPSLYKSIKGIKYTIDQPINTQLKIIDKNIQDSIFNRDLILNISKLDGKVINNIINNPKSVMYVFFNEPIKNQIEFLNKNSEDSNFISAFIVYTNNVYNLFNKQIFNHIPDKVLNNLDKYYDTNLDIKDLANFLTKLPVKQVIKNMFNFSEFLLVTYLEINSNINLLNYEEIKLICNRLEQSNFGKTTKINVFNKMLIAITNNHIKNYLINKISEVESQKEEEDYYS